MIFLLAGGGGEGGGVIVDSCVDISTTCIFMQMLANVLFVCLISITIIVG